MWILFALLAAFSAAVVVTLSKVGIKNIDSSVGFAIQSILIVIVAWSVVFFQGNASHLARIDKRSWIFLVLAGIITCLSSLFSFRALKLGDAARVASLDKVSLVFAVIMAVVFLKEKANWQVLLGVGLMGLGAVIIALARESAG
ncbi:transporter family protein [Catalinimonas alkaloidigena]|uniref:Transporter family protein n=1 Tax=Catalinimonas alkaloidigena TaxID=1075417 RepID=A0A1G8YI63_9BACT|nr:EamA family transporter [Catalinimonas alkaloidigena]SDK02436.1 transporter family protein [Catalinimonas alkaloidigena]